MQLIRSIASVNCMRAACDMSCTLSRLNKPPGTCAYELNEARSGSAVAERESEKAAHGDWWLLRFEVGKSMFGVNCIWPTIAMTDFNSLHFQLMQLCSSFTLIFFCLPTHFAKPNCSIIPFRFEAIDLISSCIFFLFSFTPNFIWTSFALRAHYHRHSLASN